MTDTDYWHTVFAINGFKDYPSDASYPPYEPAYRSDVIHYNLSVLNTFFRIEGTKWG
jgi:hypothetical protein